ncbi:hypothetical protein [Amycolatopsis sp. MtRt-6]|uniref:hypothetical protein n=1 Tax=Amycolatopsis sp. MtRt-6 TaxID=2792782 RepID=UPI001A8FD5C1|nr:hypothetical protein [Amycolatopsis sp. MtRt-6]
MTDASSTPPDSSTPAAADQPDAHTGPGSGDKTDDNLLGDEKRGFTESFKQGQHFLSPEVNQYARSALLTGNNIKELQIGDRTQIFVGHTVSRTSGSVREEVLSWIRERYLEVSGYGEMLRALRTNRVLLLRGQPGTGRVTTALHLLDHLAPGRVFRLESGETVKSLTDAGLPENNAGYVAEVPRRIAGSLTETHLEKLHGLLKDHDAYCVLVGETDPRPSDVFGDYAHDYTAPDAGALLERHASHEARTEDTEDFEDRMSGLREADWVARALGPCPRPLESVRMAAMLARHARGRITRIDVEREAARAVYFQITEWFAGLQAAPPGEERDEALRLAAFRIALAVLNKSPYHLVAEAAGRLAGRLITATGATGTRRTSLFTDDQEHRLPALRAKVIDGYTTFGQELVPMPLLVFHDERYPSAVLEYVWDNHHRMRDAITWWLTKLSKDARALVWVRAAQATGFLCGLDFVYGYTKMIASGAFAAPTKKNSWQRRMSAAIALDQAAQNEDLRPAIRRMLRRWCRSGSYTARWTAAAAQGFTLGRRYVTESLNELRIIGTPAERPSFGGVDEGLVWAAGFSIAKLLAFGEIRPVLDCLGRWIRSERSSLRRLALNAVDQLTDLYGFELDYLHIAAGSERPELPAAAQKWPLLLTLQWQQPALTEPIADLLRQSLRARAGGSVAKQVLGKWVRVAERDAECLETLARFLPYVVDAKSDRLRLKHLIERLQVDWADPLRTEVAARLTDAVHAREERYLPA